MARPVSPPQLPDADRLTAYDLEAELTDELALEDVRVHGAAPEQTVRNLELRAARLDDVDLASLAATRLERVRFADCLLTQTDLQDARLSAVVLEDCDLREIDLTGARLAAGCELRGCLLDGARSVQQLRGAGMTYPDVIAAAATLAGALGIEILDADDDAPR